jgi:transglutaminase-like putative cysteine protease
MPRRLRRALALALLFFVPACDSSTGLNEELDPRWSGPTRLVTIRRSFDLANRSFSEPVVVRFDTPDIRIAGNVLSAELTTSHPERSVAQAANGMRRVEVEIELPPGGLTTVEFTWALTLRRFDAIARKGASTPLGAGDRAAYLAPSEYVQSEHPSIQATAQQITMGISDDLARIREIVGFVRDHLDYELQPTTQGALWALENGRGDCTEYASLGVALARAVGIPARVTGLENMVAASGSSTFDNHNAAEFWVVDVGWTPVDINYSQSPVGVLPTRCVVLRWGLMTDRDRESLSVAWYTWRTVSGPTGQLEVRRMGHTWEER